MEKKIKVKIEDMAKIYSNGDGVEHINLDIYEGEFLTLLGPSGCGKTTILRVLGGFNEVNHGHVYIDDVDVTNLAPEKRPSAMVFQSYNLWPHMSVFENLAFGLRIRKTAKQDIKARIAAMLAMMKMSGTEKKFPGQLSGGQQQRIAIARALLLQPSVLLLDEPFSALDAKIRLQMRLELKRIQQDLNITVVFVTHDQEEAMSLSHRIVVMDKGKIAQIGTPTEIYDHPVSQYVASFIGTMNFIDHGDNRWAVRPEDVDLHPAGEALYEGTVTSIMLLGHYAIYNLTSRFGPIISYQQKDALSHFNEGQAISFDFKNTYEYEGERND